MKLCARQLLAAAAFTASGAMVLSACAVGLAVHVVAMGLETLFGARRSELAGDHEQSEQWRANEGGIT
jgi:hypothetical protein